MINQENPQVLTQNAKPLPAADGNNKKEPDSMSDPYQNPLRGILKFPTPNPGLCE
jgi:hypothetical protein